MRARARHRADSVWSVMGAPAGGGGAAGRGAGRGVYSGRENGAGGIPKGPPGGRKNHGGEFGELLVAYSGGVYGRGMETRMLAEFFEAIMKERGWNQTELARALGLTQPWVSRVICGTRDPSFAKVVVHLRRVGYEVRILPEAAEGEGPVKRREFIASAASVAFVPTPKGNPYRDAEYVHFLAERTNRVLYEIGGIDTARSATLHYTQLKSAVSGSKDRRLLSAASALARNVALVKYDAQDMPGAEEACKLAAAFGREAGDGEASAHALRDLSMLCSFQGKAGPAAFFAQEALKTPDLSTRDAAFALMQLGRGLGLAQGREREAKAALAKAQEIGGSLPVPALGDLLGGVGVAYKEQRRWDDAQTTLGEAVRLLGPSSPLLQANYLARQVQAALGAAEPDRAAELMVRLAAVAPTVSSARLRRYVLEILRQSARWTSVPEVREVRPLLQAAVA